MSQKELIMPFLQLPDLHHNDSFQIRCCQWWAWVASYYVFFVGFQEELASGKANSRNCWLAHIH